MISPHAPPFFLAALTAATLACGSRPETPYGLCRSVANCAEVTPLCANFRNQVTRVDVSLCTRECSTSEDCPARGTCVPIVVGAWRSLCMPRCVQDSDCNFAGAFCARTPAGDMACVP
jgi:hypothetical protein